MRVAVIFSGFSDVSGGAFTFEQTLHRSLVEAAGSTKHEFVFYAAGEASGHPDVIRISTARRDRWRTGALRGVRDVQDRLNAPRVGGDMWLERSLEEQGVDLVWFGSNWLENIGNVPFICTVWDLAHLQQPWFPEVSIHGEWERRHNYYSRILPKATRIVVPNDGLTDLLLPWFPVGRDRIIENPFPTPDFALNAGPGDEGVLRKHELEAGKYLFYPAQFWAHKNHYGALEALRRLPDYTLALSGADKGWGQLEHVKWLAKKLGVDDRVRYLGFVSVDELVALYRQAHCLLYLSWFGPENLPPLEALALGCPVVCADIPGMRTQLGGAAVFTGPTDFDGIAAAVRELEDNRLRERLAGDGQKLASERTPARYLEPMFQFLDDFEPIVCNWRSCL
jgi:glycosyltransferase involved in cell wall biosynthesis